MVTNTEKEYEDVLYDALCAHEGWHAVPEYLAKEVELLKSMLELRDRQKELRREI